MDNETSKQASNPSRNRKGRKRKRDIPKQGEEGYLTSTQLRNARKRRAKQKKRQRQTDQGPSTQADPSQQYISNPQAAPVVQEARTFFEGLNQDFSVTVGPCRGWRTVSKLAVRPDKQHNGQVSIGLFAPNSHQLIPVPQSVAHHPSINSTVAILEQLCRQTGVTPYDESTGQGKLRFVSINVERSTGSVQITLVWNSEPACQDDVLDSLCRAIISAGGGSSKRKRRRGRKVESSGIENGDTRKNASPKIPLHSLWVHFNSTWKHSNAIFSIEGGKQRWELRYGPSCITDSLDLKDAGQQESVPLMFPPNVFRQANLNAFAKIVARIRKYLSEDEPGACVELYGGVGTIGLNIADLVSSLVSSDENPHNLECFTESVSRMPGHLQKRLSYEPKNASDMVQCGALDGAQVVIVDPPRKGLDDDVLQAICTADTPRLLVYVSCGFTAFQRDCRALLSNWRLNHAEGHVLFPGSDAIETLAFFVK